MALTLFNCAFLHHVSWLKVMNDGILLFTLVRMCNKSRDKRTICKSFEKLLGDSELFSVTSSA